MKKRKENQISSLPSIIYNLKKVLQCAEIYVKMLIKPSCWVESREQWIGQSRVANTARTNLPNEQDSMKSHISQKTTFHQISQMSQDFADKGEASAQSVSVEAAMNQSPALPRACGHKRSALSTDTRVTWAPHSQRHMCLNRLNEFLAL